MSACREEIHPRRADDLRDIAQRCAENTMLRRVFLVGCPRSGTTLLQSLLHAHRCITSLPETHFLPRLLGCEEHRRSAADGARGLGARFARRRRRLLADIGLVDPMRARTAWRHLQSLGLQVPIFAHSWQLTVQVAAFTATLDACAHGMDKAVWLEKTPDHLFYIDRIATHVPDARFIHLHRDGRQVAASLHHAAREYPQWRPYLDLSRCVDRWATATRESARWRNGDRHLHVRYEDLIDHPDDTLAQIFAFLGCEPDPGLWSRYRHMADGLIQADEPWKQGNLQPIHRHDSFHEVLDAGQRQQVETLLAQFNADEHRRNH
jgi:hypothetical protein